MERTKTINRIKQWAARQVMASGTQRTMTLDELINLLSSKEGRRDGGALSEVTYFTCLRILSESLGKLPLKIMRHNADGGVSEHYAHPLYDILRTRPCPPMTATGFWSTMELARNHYGNAYAWIRGAGSATSLWPLEPGRVRAWWDDACILADAPAVWYVYRDPKGKERLIHSDSMLHLRTSMSRDGVTGLAVQDILSASVAGAAESQGVLNRLYSNGMTAKAALQYTGELSDELREAFARLIEEYAQGKVDNVKNFIPLPLGVSIQPLDLKLTDAQFVELRRYSALQIAAAFGIKPNQINDYEKASYAAAEQQNISFLVDTMLFPVKMYEEEIKFKLLWRDKTVFPKFNVAVLLRADMKTQIETLKAGVTSMIYTPNEARALLDKSALPGGDRLYANGNLIPLTMAGEQYKNGGGSNE